MSRSARCAFLVALVVLALMPGLSGGRFGSVASAQSAPVEVGVPEVPEGPFIRVSPAADKVAVNLPVWLAVDPAVWRPLTTTTDIPASTTTTTTASTVVPPPPTAATVPVPPPAPTRVTVTVRPLYVDWDLGEGGEVRCFGRGTVYDPDLPLSAQASECRYTYRQPQEEVTIRAAVTYGTVAVVQVPGQAPREEVLASRVARDELKVRVNELQALDPGVALAELFPPGAEAGGPPVSAQVELPSEDEPSEARAGEYFPEPPGAWERFTGFVKDVGPTVLKVAAVVVTAVVVTVAVAAICATGVGCALLVGAAAGLAAGAVAGGLFCGLSAECIGKGALAGAVAGLAFAAAPLILPVLGVTGAGSVVTAMFGGALAGFSGTLVDGLLNGNTDPKTLIGSTILGGLTAGLLAKAAPGLMSRLRLGSKPPAGQAPAARQGPPASKAPATSPGSGANKTPNTATGLADDAATPAARATGHGAERLAQAGFTDDLIAQTRAGFVTRQSDGAAVYVREVSPGRFDFFVEGQRGVVTAHRNWSQKSIDRLARNYGWEGWPP